MQKLESSLWSNPYTGATFTWAGPSQSLGGRLKLDEGIGVPGQQVEAHLRNTSVLTRVSPGQSGHWSVVETEGGDHRGPGRGPWGWNSVLTHG